MKHQCRCPKCKHVATYNIPDPEPVKVVERVVEKVGTDWSDAACIAAIALVVLVMMLPFIALACAGGS